MFLSSFDLRDISNGIVMSENCAQQSVRIRDTAASDIDVKHFAVCASESLMRWSSEPVSLNSSSSIENSNVADFVLVNNARCAVVALQRQFACEHERCRQLEADLSAERRNSSAGIEAVVRCVEHERAEKRRLQATVWLQKRHISKLRHQLRIARSKFSVAECHSITSHVSVSDHDGACSDPEPGFVCFSDEYSQRRVHFSHDDVASNELDRSEMNGVEWRGRRDKAEHKAVQTVRTTDESCSSCGDGGSSMLSMFGNSSSSYSLSCNNNSDRELLKQRLSDTISVCLRLAQSLGTRRRSVQSESTDDGSMPAAGDQVLVELSGGLHNTPLCDDGGLAEEDHYRQQVTRLEARLKEMEQVNEEWQQYAEQRDQYVRVLAHRCGELEQLHSKCSVPSSATDEQQRNFDCLLRDQRQQTELAEKVRNQVEKEKQRLDEALKNMTCAKMDADARLAQAVTRLRASDARRVKADERIQILETQVAVYSEDFRNEQRDHMLTKERLAGVERRLEAVSRKLRSSEYGTSVFLERQDDSEDSSYRRSFQLTSGGQRDASLPLLIARGAIANPPVNEAQSAVLPAPALRPPQKYN